MKDIYVKFDSPAIKGESQDKDHKDWIEVSSWLQSITQPRSATASTAGGHTAERCEHADMVFFRADGEGNRVKYQEVKLKNAILSNVSSQAVDTGIPNDSFSLRYAAVQWKYTQQKSAGGQGGNSQGAWSLTKNDKTYSV
jgi:type VI secretion system secreted protein Hcp